MSDETTTEEGLSPGLLASAMRRLTQSSEEPEAPQPTTFVEHNSLLDLLGKLLPNIFTARKQIVANRQNLQDIDQQLFGNGQ